MARYMPGAVPPMLRLSLLVFGLVGLVAASSANAQVPAPPTADPAGDARPAASTAPSGSTPTAQPRVATSPAGESAGYTGPNRAVITVGVLSLGLWYLPAVIISSKSNIAADRSLAIPLIGPWLDLSARPQCGPGSISCRVETGNKVLLVVDGLFQAWGLAAAVIGVFMHEQPRSSAGLHIAPTLMGVGGYGVAAGAAF
jgi:hypothetical protein